MADYIFVFPETGNKKGEPLFKKRLTFNIFFPETGNR
jgi:hypothetical protein